MDNLEIEKYKLDKQIDDIDCLKNESINYLNTLEFEDIFYNGALDLAFGKYENQEGFIEYYSNLYKKIGAIITTGSFVSAIALISANIQGGDMLKYMSSIPGLMGLALYCASTPLAYVKYDRSSIKANIDYITRKLNQNKEYMKRQIEQIKKYEAKQHEIKTSREYNSLAVKTLARKLTK